MHEVTTQMIGMLAETFIHPGTGKTMGAIDLPVAREAATDYPYIAGSSLKGAMRSAFERARGIRSQNPADDETEAVEAPAGDTTGNALSARNRIFGDDKQEAAGGVLVSDARLLLLPVRSLSSSYKWVTCPHVLERLYRDRQRCGLSSTSATLPTVNVGDEHGYYACCADGDKEGKLFLEERSFITQRSDELDTIVDILKQYIPDAAVAQRLESQLVILSNDDFTWFARYGLAVNARNVLSETKTSKNLWYEETIPPDTLMYSMLAARYSQANTEVSTLREQLGQYLQVGGNETVGQGWFKLEWLESSRQSTAEATHAG